MDRERIEARCRVANWATIISGFVALSTPIVLALEAVVWVIERRWPTLANVTGWRPQLFWLRAISFMPTSAFVLVIGATTFFISIAYWRTQERLRRRLRAPLRPPLA